MLYPNPAKDQLNILVEVRHPGPLHISLQDVNGRVVKTLKRANIGEGYQHITLGNLNLPAGTYIAKVKAGNITKTTKVVFE